MKTTTQETDPFFREYTSQDAITKYTRTTAGFGIGYLLDHDYKRIYLDAIRLLPPGVKKGGLQILEFGCGGGMNLIHLTSVLKKEGIQVARAIGTDFSPVLIDAARSGAASDLAPEDQRKVEFYVAKNETLMSELSMSLKEPEAKLANSFHFVFGVNTTRYNHRANKEVDSAKDIFNLLVPGGVAVVIDMNDRFPLFRSALKQSITRSESEEECYVPSLAEYAAPFAKVGFEMLRTDNFCWIPHSSGVLMSRIMGGLSPVLNVVAKSRAMRSLVVVRKPA
jgi:SAM-dependent methyltransferase